MQSQLNRMMIAAALLAGLALTPARMNAAARTLDIYFIDVEGGQSTLIVTPAGQSLLIDAGFPGDGTFASKAGLASQARDPQRILTAARDAGIARIDYLLVTHFHGDHVGGVVELAQLMPIGTFIDHTAPPAEAEAGVPGTLALYQEYLSLRASGKHLQPVPGDRLPLTGLDAIIVSSGGATISEPLSGAGAPNGACRGSGVPAQDAVENPRSTGVRIAFGNFRFLDVGDLSGPLLFGLTCPRNLIGTTDVYLIAHHGGADAADAAMFSAVAPRVAIFNNGDTKGGSAETLATVRQLQHTDAWQLHRSMNPGAVNTADFRIANLDLSTQAWIKVSARANGSFTVTNGRTGATQAYER